MTLNAVGIGRRAGQRWLFRDVSLSVHGGQRLALAGATGSGKTSLLRALALLDPIDAGEVRWGSDPIRGGQAPDFRSRVVYFHQRPALLEATVEENLKRPFLLRAHRGKQFDRRRVVDWLAELDRSEEFLAKHQRALSGGEAQLTALLRGMQLDPKILLLDEPTAALDAGVSEMVERLVAHWVEQQKSRAVVWVTHDAEQARRIATDVLQISDGRLVT